MPTVYRVSPRIGKTLVNQGVWHGYLEHTGEELESFLSALHYLPASSERPDVRKNRFSCLMNLGITYRKLGDPERAGRYAAMASEVAGDIGPQLFLHGRPKLDEEPVWELGKGSKR